MTLTPLNHNDADDVTLNGDAKSEMKAELDDERRDVPQGWVRAFDRKAGHHFYALADPSVASQSTWTHPYDSPAFLASLPADHPASPGSSAAQAYAKKGADEKAAHSKSQAEAGKEKGWLSKTLEKVVGGDGPGSEEKRAISDAEENFVKRREALINGDVDALGTKRKYAADPFVYSAPSEAFNRHASSDVKYAFGYFGGYQRRYTPALGYDKISKPSAGYIQNAADSWLQGAGSPVAGHTSKSNYGYHG